MKLFINILLIAVFSFAVSFYLPWWGVAVVAFVSGWVSQFKPIFASLAAFIALFVLWGGISLYLSIANDYILAEKITMVVFDTNSYFLLIFVTAFVGGLVAGMAALSGSLFRIAILNK